MIATESLYSGKRIMLPTPKFYVLYNGEEEQPERRIMKLSDSYVTKDEEVSLELLVTQLNINDGYNTKIKESCQTLREYMQYVDKIREFSKTLPLEEAVDAAVCECIEEGIPEDFLRKNRAEVVQMSIYEYNQEKHIQLVREEGRYEGRQEGEKIGRREGEKIGRREGEKIGRQEGEKRINLLNTRLAEEGRVEDIVLAAKDKEVQERLMKEYQI